MASEIVQSDLDYSICDREPIHIPGAIQPHGAFLAARVDTSVVTHASANLDEMLGISAGAALGQTLRQSIGALASGTILDAISRDHSALYQLSGWYGKDLHLTAYRVGPQVCIDVEPVSPSVAPISPVHRVRAVLDAFRSAEGQRELCALAVRSLREITGYDRVMAYRFDTDGHGEVIAEARGCEMDPYLGLHYPASDIPPQARQLYLRQRVGAIVDSRYRPVPLLTDRTLDHGTPLDLTCSTLRSVSPYHLAYMQNMQTAASLTIGLAEGPELWGMLVCHHRTPRNPGPELRAAADILGQFVSTLLGPLGEAEAARKRVERNATMMRLAEQFASAPTMLEAFAATESELLDLVDAAGAIISFAGVVRCIGRTPPPGQAERALARLRDESAGELLACDDLGLRHPELSACKRGGSGALLLPLVGADDAMLWFRPEQSRTTRWGGNPAEPALADAATGLISPRASFAVWIQTVSGHSAPWKEGDIAIAHEFRKLIEGETARRTKAELTQLRLAREQDQIVQAARLKVALENLRDGVAMFDADSRLVMCNNLYAKLYRLPEALQQVGTHIRDIVQSCIANGVVADDIGSQEEWLKLYVLPTDTSSRIQQLSDGRLINLTRQPLPEGGWVSTHEDITEQQRREAEILFLAHHDLLTGLANRAAFDETVETAVARLQRNGEPFTLFMLDLDRFKQVNDTFGHPAGDQLLREAAQRLRSSVRKTDILARLGGDEFAIVQFGAGDRFKAAKGLAERIVRLISQPFDLGGAQVSVGISIGIAIAPHAATDAAALLKMADVALYAVKSEGRNGFRFFEPEA
ncbi:diguanylate cyclase with GAF sensor [Rhodopseudomonas palustris HaA2]|uniref:Diguanylate cyclase with GAF sensor n=1 Tax=Rhodopseudomonas palustris (strain HaA2) TaxID=316058 RepID=Q2IY35_RHOP2|nr:diguanylate cyclase [Rhodopseudomonas palustris]ABD06875.1 diguanylate cyclase with GAF sensor [Rhodopseudomonas palustris HaA2]